MPLPLYLSYSGWGQQQIAKRVLTVPSVRMKIALVGADNPALAQLLGQQDQRSIRQVSRQIRILAHQFGQARQMVGTMANTPTPCPANVYIHASVLVTPLRRNIKCTHSTSTG